MIKSDCRQIGAINAAAGNVNDALLKDGSVPLDSGYTPSSANDLVPKAYVDSGSFPEVLLPGNFVRTSGQWLNINTVLASTVGEAGQIGVSYSTTLSLTGFSQNVTRTFDIAAATPTLVNSVQLYPNSAPNKGTPNPENGYSSIFDVTRTANNPAGIVGKLIENPVNLQYNIWRLRIEFENKANNANPGLRIGLINPTSGFPAFKEYVLPSGTGEGQNTIEIITIGNSASIPAPEGYILQATSTQSDSNLIVRIANITRITSCANTLF